MNFTIEDVSASLAKHLRPWFPEMAFFEGPNQKDSVAPCMFLQQCHSKIIRKQAGRFLRRIDVELTCLMDDNLPNLQKTYQQIAETLDQVMEIFPYNAGGETALLRTYEREWNIDWNSLHYRFELQVWTQIPEPMLPMQSMEYREEIRDG